MHITLYRKYRSQDFEEVAGQKEIIQTIKTSLKNNKVAHAYLFTGPRGVGKTTIARLMAKGVNCLTNGITDTPCNTCANCKAITDGNFMDMLEIDAASNRGIDEIRELKEKINYKPVNGRKKVYIIDEVHMLTKEAFNALLKTLEEPPEHVMFILATTEADKILPTIISRCQRFDFKFMALPEMTERLKFIATQENIKIDDEALEIIYEASGGSMRDAISILERIHINFFDATIDREKIESVLGITPLKKLSTFLEFVKESDKENAVHELEILWNESCDIELFFKDLAKLAKSLMEKKELNIDFGLRLISSIFNSLSKFKFEEDKRLVGYIIISELMALNVKPRVEVREVIREVASSGGSSVKSSNNVGGTTDIDTVLKMWDNILKEIKKEKIALFAFLAFAKPTRIEGNDLIIMFNSDNAFQEEQLKRRDNKEILERGIFDVLGVRLDVKTESVKGKTSAKVVSEKDGLADSIIDFFGGQVVED